MGEYILLELLLKSSLRYVTAWDRYKYTFIWGLIYFAGHSFTYRILCMIRMGYCPNINTRWIEWSAHNKYRPHPLTPCSQTSFKPHYAYQAMYWMYFDRCRQILDIAGHPWLLSTPYGLMMPYGVMDLCQHCFRQSPVVWRQVIVWINVDSLSIKSRSIYIGALSHVLSR